MGEKRNIKALFDRYRKGIATEEEKQIVAAWLSQLDASEQPLSDERVEQLAERSLSELRQHLLLPQPERKISRLGYWMPRAAAACLVGALAVFLVKYLAQSRNASAENNTTLAAVHNATDHSLLRLANGTEIGLDTDSTLTIDESTRIHIRGREIVYESIGNAATGAHTLITAKGDRCQVVLADSTRIFLNAASAITYPVQFDEDTRIAQMSGEAYFEVSRAANWPFIVKTGGDVAIRVLGTAFNINAYKENNAVQTTLISGSVELNAGASRQQLKPSQQAIYSLNDQQLKIHTVNTDRETDWIYNRLVFRETPMKEVLASLARFYNVEFNVKNKVIYQYTFTGTFENKPLERVLEYMQISSKIRYTVLNKGKKKIVELK